VPKSMRPRRPPSTASLGWFLRRIRAWTSQFRSRGMSSSYTRRDPRHHITAHAISGYPSRFSKKRRGNGIRERIGASSRSHLHVRQGGPGGEFAQLVVPPDFMDIRRHRNKNVSVVFCRFQFGEPHLQIRSAVIVYDELCVKTLWSENAGREWLCR